MNLGAAIGGLVNPVAAVGTGSQFIGGIMQNEWNKEEASKNRQFQAGMSNTSYQRAVADLRTAGLNPMLAYSQGGASTPSGAQAQMENVAEGASATALDMVRLKEDIQNIRAQTEKTKQDVKIGRQTEALIDAQKSGVVHDNKVKQALGTAAEILQPGLEGVGKASERLQSAPKWQSDPGKSWSHGVKNMQIRTPKKGGGTVDRKWNNSVNVWNK